MNREPSTTKRRKRKPKVREPIPQSVFYYPDIGEYGRTSVTSYHEVKYFIDWGPNPKCTVHGRFLPEHDLWTRLDDDMDQQEDEDDRDEED